jgi:hypothetical protein
MRSLITLIDEMLAVIPKRKTTLIDSLKDIQDSQRCRAPEDMLGWQLVSEELQNLNLNRWSPKWKFELCSIFSTLSIEEIKNELKKNK